MLPILPGPIQPGAIPSSASAPTLPAAPGDPTADATGAGSFLDQLAAALASLTPSQPGQPEPEAPTDAPEGEDDATQNDQATDQVMADLAASFGLLPMPLAVNDLPLGTPGGQADTAVMAAGMPPSTLPMSTLSAQTATADTAPTSDAPATTAPQAQDASTDAGQASAQQPLPSPAAAAEKDRAPQPAVGDRLPEVRPAHDPDPHAGKPAHQAEAVIATPAAHSQAAEQLTASAQAHADGDQHGHGHADQQDGVAPTSDAALPDPTTAATPFSGVMGAVASTPQAAANAAHPREVVAQIAQQAELYRLPGGRGVRIQLHPDGLGGVEVTLRYSSAGALQLHVNVEHAATGALVQAGWNDLRDALSQQGISPDRLVMSVSGPDGAGLSSDSGNFGSDAGSGSGSNFRPDTGPMGFGQSSQGQQERQPASGARARWTPGVDATPSEPDTAAPASSSRIDLRV
jgi:flagellar hook-length control protein FliK